MFLRRKGKVDYATYIQSDEWRAKADAARARAGYRCQVCNQGEVQLDAHHRTYERLGSERPEDITVLCHACHKLFESRRRKMKTDMPRNGLPGRKR